jgi:predicted phage-related endonuclease
LWHEKAGVIEDNFEESPFSLWGRRLQIPVGLGICEDEGWRGKDLTGHYFHDPEINSGSSLDMEVETADRGRGHLEIKVSEAFRAEDGWGENSAPVWYEFQMQAQLHEAFKSGQPYDFNCLGTLGRRQQTRLLFREYDSAFGEYLDNEIKGFWQSIKDGQPPPPDYSVDADLLGMLAKPVRKGEKKNMSLDNRAAELMHIYQEIDDEAAPLREKLKELGDKKSSIKAEIHEKMGNAEIAVIGDYQVGAKVQHNDEKFVPAHEFRRFDVKKRRK